MLKIIISHGFKIPFKWKTGLNFQSTVPAMKPHIVSLSSQMPRDARGTLKLSLHVFDNSSLLN